MSTPIHLHTEPAPPDSLLKGMTVVYQDEQGTWRCPANLWPAYLAEVERREKEKRA